MVLRLGGKGFADDLAHHTQEQVPLRLAVVEQVVPLAPVGFIIQLIGVLLIMKPKKRINLAAVLLFFGFINSKCLMQQL